MFKRLGEFFTKTLGVFGVIALVGLLGILAVAGWRAGWRIQPR